MLLANVVLMAQIASSAPREVNRPCADESALCRISPFFCPGAYPKGMEPCWPEGTRQPRNIGSRGGAKPPSSGVSSTPNRAPAPSRTRSGPAKLTRLDPRD